MTSSDAVCFSQANTNGQSLLKKMLANSSTNFQLHVQFKKIKLV